MSKEDKSANALLLLGAALIVFAAGLLLNSCSRTLESFSFSSAAARAIPILVSGNVRAADENKLAGGTSRPPRSPDYRLKTPIAVGSASSAFALDYRDAEGSLQLVVSLKDAGTGVEREITAPLPIGKVASFRFLLPLPKGSSVTAFQVSGQSASSKIFISGAGITDDSAGIEFSSDGRLTIREGISLREEQSNGVTTYDVAFPNDRFPNDDAARSIAMSYSYRGGTGAVTVTVSGDSRAADGGGRGSSSGGTSGAGSYGGTDGAGGNDAGASSGASYQVHPVDGTHVLYFYEGNCDCIPSSVRIVDANRGFGLEAVHLGAGAAMGSTDLAPATGSTSDTTGQTAVSGTAGAGGALLAPLPADFGAIITNDPSHWRSSGFELYRWTLFPSVLVMAARSLDEQSRFFKRLAFFVEKAGHAGTLMTNSELQGLHGWNAHDYRPEDLARFFNTAAARSFPLNPEEVTLRRILLANGVLTEGSAGAVQPGNGAILSIAYEGSYWLRYVLLTHEGYHGVYFTHSGYRDAVKRVWDALPLSEQQYWRLFLGVRGYNADDDYLVVNEFEAYLMQQPVSEVESYFRGANLAALSNLSQWNSLGLGGYVGAHPDMFRAEAEAIQDALNKAAGVMGGSLVEMTPAPYR